MTSPVDSAPLENGKAVPKGPQKADRIKRDKKSDEELLAPLKGKAPKKPDEIKFNRDLDKVNRDLKASQDLVVSPVRMRLIALMLK